jgi:hypothetical protein
VQLPADAILRAAAPDPPRARVRTPPPLEQPAGALEVYLSEEQFRAALAALGRGG